MDELKDVRSSDKKGKRTHDQQIISTLFMAVIALVAPFIPVDIEVLAYSAYHKRKESTYKIHLKFSIAWS